MSTYTTPNTAWAATDGVTVTDLDRIEGNIDYLETQAVADLADYTRNPGYATNTGAVNVYVVTLTPVPTAYVAGMRVCAQITVTNTSTSPTLNVNGLGAKTIRKSAGVSLNVGDLVSNGIYEFIYSTYYAAFLLLGGDTDATKLGGVAASDFALTGHSQAASTVTAGTLAGQVIANATAVTTLTTAQVRNIYAGTTDMTAGTTALTTGDIYLMYV
jgi:hypothetical protein